MAQLSTTLRDAPPRGTCRSFLMAGTLRVRTAEKTTLKPWGSLSVRRPKLPASAFGLAPGRFTCSATSHRLTPFPCGDQSFLRQRLVSHPVASLAPLRLTALTHSKLDMLWHNRCAGGATFPCRHPSFLRQRRVSAWVASLATLGRGHVLQHATQPRGRHSSHTQALHAYVPTLSLCHRPCHPSTRATLIAHSSPPRLCTYALVMPSFPMLRGGSNHHDGSNGI